MGTFHQRFVVSQRKRSSPLTAAPLKDMMCFRKGLWDVRAWSLWSGEAGSQNSLPGSQNPLPYPQILCLWFRGLCLHILNSALGFFRGLLFNVRGGWRNCVSDPHCNMYRLPISIVSIYWESCPVLWLFSLFSGYCSIAKCMWFIELEFRALWLKHNLHFMLKRTGETHMTLGG